MFNNSIRHGVAYKISFVVFDSYPSIRVPRLEASVVISKFHGAIGKFSTLMVRRVNLTLTVWE